MLRASEAAEVRVQDVELKQNPRLVSLVVKMDQGAKGLKRARKCCVDTPCKQLCPRALAMRALADHANDDPRCSCSRTNQGRRSQSCTW